MDIEFLLWLQGIREALGPSVEWIANAITSIPLSPISYVIPFVFYLWIDKRVGAFIIANVAIAGNLNQSIKDTFCIYRPWMRNSALHASKLALPNATGYSFPSGHSQSMVSIWGTTACYEHKKYPLIARIMWVLVALVAFSRLYLGVHTPQDVFVGLCIGAITLGILTAINTRKQPISPRAILVAGVVVSIVIVAYTMLKPYPKDFISGTLTVDPKEMRLDAYSNVGILLAASLGWYCEERFVCFSCDISKRDKVIRLCTTVVVALLFFGLAQIIKHTVGGAFYAFAKVFLPILAAIWIGPLLAEYIRTSTQTRPR